MKKIKTLTRNESAQIILVGTHLDEFNKASSEQRDAVNETLGLLQKTINRLQLKLLGLYCVSCTDGLGIKDLKDKILEIAENCSHFQKLPQTYVNLLEVLKKERAKKAKQDALGIISWQTFCQMAQLCHVKAKAVQDVAQFLHDTGNIVHFHDTQAGLDDIVILNPQALVRCLLRRCLQLCVGGCDVLYYLI